MRNRLLISGLAASGALETGFLSYTKLVPDLLTTFCTDNTCSNVLSGPYSTIPVINVPLVSVAFFSYAAVSFLALSPYLKKNTIIVEDTIKNIIDPTLLFIVTSMATFSCYLMALLFFIIHEKCNFCFFSAFVSLSMAVIAWNSDVAMNHPKQSVIKGASIGMTALSSLALFFTTSIIYFSNGQSAEASTAVAGQILTEIEQNKNKQQSPPSITTHSTNQAIELSNRMNALGSKMYGAYWCSHCFSQKQILGVEAFKQLQYLECDKEGKDTQFFVCLDKKIPGYPTWEISGQFYPGEKTVNELLSLVEKIEKEKQ